jgi:hypothetical protein
VGIRYEMEQCHEKLIASGRELQEAKAACTPGVKPSEEKGGEDDGAMLEPTRATQD